MQSDCRSIHSAGLESAPDGVPEVTVLGVGTEDSTLLSGGAAGALTEPNVADNGSTDSGDAGTLLIPSAGADGAEVGLLDPKLPIADGLVPLPGDIGLLEVVMGGERAVSGTRDSTLEERGAGGAGGVGNADPKAGLNVSFE